jgi:hypothetical protein
MQPPYGYNSMQGVEAHMAQDRFQTRLPADDADRVEEYRAAHEISQAEAVRRLIRAGLEAEFQDDDDLGQLQRAGLAPGIIQVILLLAVLGLQTAILAGVTF